MCTVFHETDKDSHSNCLLRQEHALYVDTKMEIVGGEGTLSYSTIERSHKETKTHDKSSRVEHNLTRFGGPSYIENFRKWRNLLIQYPGTWRVIHRDDIIGIWNIILNYKSEIVNCTQVAGLLQRTWEQNWGESSNIKIVDKILINNILSIFEKIDLTENYTADTIMQILKQIAGIATGNRKFEEYIKRYHKWNQLLEKAVSMTEELHLESRFHLKMLLRLAGQRMINLNKKLLTWYNTPLLCCNENVVGKIIAFIQNDFRYAYESLIKYVSDPYCRRQIEDQVSMEIARIIYHHGQRLTNVEECILLAEIAIKLPFDFAHFTHEKECTQVRSTGKTCETVETFFSSLSLLGTQENTAPGEQCVPKSAIDFVNLIEKVYFPTLEITAELFFNVDQLKLRQTVYCRMTALRKKC
ncbi:unnamed protein product [Mytilus edulis]|uniref:Uncharacterized protein n=1 Tax=Mytilus edulis TaxID=6550 RepID=A0A8S3UNV9_MYTED|nr:unnamed protein product [Mytilus edulis]